MHLLFTRIRQKRKQKVSETIMECDLKVYEYINYLFTKYS